ncbi:hypothetical protein ACFRIC_29545 [Streptomyces sp. NPDC056738]|uniref:hypothetical protein n=1 Tax=Streptomyces sp. NPDC056738 TaxID=3345933 RepID=UPI0036ADDFF5
MAKRVRQVSAAQRARTGAGTDWRTRLAAGARTVLLRSRVPGGRRTVLAAGAVIAAVAVTVTWYLLSRGDSEQRLPDTRARHYTDVDACLLTGKDGITAGTTAAEVWQGMQDASLTTHARVSYVPVTGEQSAANARPYLNGLLQRSCDVVVAAGKPEATAAGQAAPQYRKVGFVLVGGQAGSTADGKGGTKNPANVTVAHTGDGLRAEVARVVEREVNARD